VGGLFVQYKVEFWYWELLEMVRKLLLASSIPMLIHSSATQITVALFTLLFFLSAFLWGSPYRSSVPNYLQAYIQLTLFCTLYYGQQSASCIADPSRCSSVMPSLLVCMQVSILLFPVATLVYRRVMFKRTKIA